MEFEVKYEYTKDWIPPRCRKPRPGTFTDTVLVTIPEVKASEAPWACVVHTHRRYFDELPVNALRHHGGKFYERAMIDMRIDRTHYAKDSYGDAYWWCDYETTRIHQRRGMTIEEAKQDVRWHAGWESRQDKVIDAIVDCASKYIIVNGEVWHEVGEPMYCIYTFGLGHNHGGSSLSVDFAYNNNISSEMYFNANDFERAANRFFEIALGRGDTESAHQKAVELATGDVWNYIEVIDPTVFTRNPAVEHCDGDPFMNMLYGVTSNTDNATEAGLLAVACLAGELA